MRVSYPEPLEERAVLSVRRDGVEPPKPGGGWVTATWARQCPADAYFVLGYRPALACLWVKHVRLPVARVGVEPTNNHEGLSFAALPVCVPRRLT